MNRAVVVRVLWIGLVVAVVAVLTMSQAREVSGQIILRRAEMSSVRETPHSRWGDDTWLDPSRNRQIPVRVYWPSSGPGPWPVIVFSHGLGSSRFDYSYLGQTWARHGYVSVHVQHLGSDAGVWKNHPRKMKRLRESFQDPRNPEQRPLDIRFAINRLEAINSGQGKPGDAVLRGRLAMHRLGVAGHGFGSLTALTVAGQRLYGDLGGSTQLADPRVKAAILMSPSVPSDRTGLRESYASVRVPCFHITGMADDTRLGTTGVNERRIPFDLINRTDQYLVTFRKADHLTFLGHKLAIRGRNDLHHQQMVATASTVFWDAYLKGDPPSRMWLLDNGINALLGQSALIEKKPAGNGSVIHLHRNPLPRMVQ